jgi:hypothetical protein
VPRTPALASGVPAPDRECHRRFDVPPGPMRPSRVLDFRRIWLRLEIVQQTGGLAARPPVRYMLKVARSE